MHESGDYLFMPKETVLPGAWRVMMEPRGQSISIFDQHIFSIELKNPSYESAKALADYLNEHVAHLSLTRI